MSYSPSPVPTDAARLGEFLRRELQRIASETRDDRNVVQYRTRTATASISAGVSANWKIAAGNIVRISTSNTLTLTGLELLQPYEREIALVNVGTGVLVLTSEDSASSASLRFALPATWALSANASCVLWYDSVSSRFRGLGKT
jgi:hypothetical protein